VLAEGATVAGGDHEQDVVLVSEPVYRLAHRVGPVGGRPTEAHVDHIGALRGGPLHAGDDVGLEPVAVVIEYLGVDQLNPRRHPDVCPVRGGPGAGDDPGHVGAVAVPVIGGVGELREVTLRHHLADQVRVV